MPIITEQLINGHHATNHEPLFALSSSWALNCPKCRVLIWLPFLKLHSDFTRQQRVVVTPFCTNGTNGPREHTVPEPSKRYRQLGLSLQTGLKNSPPIQWQLVLRSV